MDEIEEGVSIWPLTATIWVRLPAIRVEEKGTIALLAESLRTEGIILVGEPYWLQLPPTEDVAKRCLAGSPSQSRRIQSA